MPLYSIQSPAITTLTHDLIRVLRLQVEWLAAKMHEGNHTVSAVHSDMDEDTREVMMREFGSGSSRVLKTTDLFARGIDRSEACAHHASCLC